MTKQKAYEQELEKLNGLFENTDESKRKLVQGLIQDAAFLFAENQDIKELLNKTGMIKVHPDNPEMQKPIAAAEQYRKNLNSYSIVIKTLSSMLPEDSEEDDDLGEYE
jgi:regulator of replication initiation timing